MYILDSIDLFLPIIVHIPFDVLNPFQHYLLISYMLLPDVGIWCNRALCVETTHSTYFTAISPLVSVLFVPSLHSYYFSRKFLSFSLFMAITSSIIIPQSSRNVLAWLARPSCKRPVGVEGKGRSSGTLD